MRAMERKLVSVIIPAFKMGRFIREALDSVGAQTHPDWELIVVDDAGPDDGTCNAVEDFASRFQGHRVELVRHERNRGVSAARRSGFVVSKGDYIAFLDADDTFLPDKLARHVAILEESPGCVLVHGPVLVDRVDQGQVGPGAGFGFSGEEASEYRLFENLGAFQQNRICNSTVVCRRRSLSEDCFPQGMVYQFEDWFTWLRLGSEGTFRYSPERLTRYRVHPTSFSAQNLWVERNFIEFARFEMLAAYFGYAPDFRMRVRVASEVLNLAARMMLERSSGRLKDPEVLGRRLSAALGWALAEGTLRRIVRALRR